MCEKRVRAQNPFGSILNPSAPKGHGADPLGVGANTQKSKQALFKIDKAPWVKKRAPTKNPFGSILHPSTLKGPGADPVGVGINTQKPKQALFNIDKAPCVKKGLRHRTLSEAF